MTALVSYEQLLALRAGEPLLPLTEGQASGQAYRLRCKHGFSYEVLSRLMGEYHGHWHSAHYWQRHCRRLGAPAKSVGRLTPQARRELAA